MSYMLRVLAAFIGALMLLAVANAADMQNVTDNPPAANWQIDRWAEGVILSIDAKNNKITMHGHERAWASEYAKMAMDLHNKTRTLTPAERQTKASEIRQSYADSLAKARSENVKDTDFTFYAPKETNGRINLIDTADGKNWSTNVTMHGLDDLKIGENMTFGYSAGTLYNYAFDGVKGSASDEQLENIMNATLGDVAPSH